MDLAELPPGRYFVAHDFDDVAEVDNLLRSLPSHASAVVFEKVTLGRDDMVSDRLIPAIRSCTALIHLTSPASEASSWVTFEADYARRSGLSVYAYDPATRELAPSGRPLLDLTIRATYNPTDTPLVERVRGHLARRHLRLGETRDCCTVVFWSSAAAAGPGVPRGTEPGRAILATLDDTPVPVNIEQLVVHLSPDGDLSPRRIDDLTVRLYGLLLSHQHCPAT